MADEFKVGMKVCLSSKNGESISTITEITKAGNIRISQNPAILFKPSGHLRTSDPWNSSMIEPATEEDVIRIRKNIDRKNLMTNIKNKMEQLTNFSMEDLEKIKLLIDECYEHAKK
jgi:hypothetical protein